MDADSTEPRPAVLDRGELPLGRPRQPDARPADRQRDQNDQPAHADRAAHSFPITALQPGQTTLEDQLDGFQLPAGLVSSSITERIVGESISANKPRHQNSTRERERKLDEEAPGATRS